jgi:clan AA aspartic protease (TIGR02281 family)
LLCLIGLGTGLKDNPAPMSGISKARLLMAAADKFDPIDTQLQPQEGVSVPLQEDDRALILKARLDQSQTVRLLVDTGATYTTISDELAQKLGYSTAAAPKVSINTANGKIRLPRIRLRSLALNGYTVHNVEATVMPMPKNASFSGLLGLSFIRRYRITIDPEAQRLIIQPSSV